MGSWSTWVLIAVFVVGAAVIWVSGVQLSRQTDVLATRLHLGEALGGLILLAIATNLPEIAITVSAAVSGDVSVAVGNILGGIALQTVVLVILDIGTRGKGPLTNKAASLSLIVEAAVVIAVLGIVVAGSQLPKDLILFRLTPGAVLIAVAWVGGLVLTNRAGKHLPWHGNGTPSDAQQEPKGHSRQQTERHSHISTAKAALIFGGAALATLVAGVAVEESGDIVSQRIGLSGVLFGATVLALATSLPEISTGLTAVRNGDFRLAMSDIFGGNSFLPVLFLVATVISGKAVLPQAGSADIYLTALAVLLTVVYLVGVLFRSRRHVLRMGIDSLTVLVLYLIGVGGLIAVASA